MKIKVNDKVMVVAGKDKGKEGVVQFVKGDKVVVEGVNMVTKHVKPDHQNPEGGLDRREAPIHVSNVMILAGEKPTRVGYKVQKNKNGNTEKIRIAKVDDSEI